MLDVPAKDFAFMLSDWGRTVLVRHIVGETINTDTGAKTKVENETRLQAIVQSVSKKDIENYPSIFSVTDRRCFYKEDDATIEKGDTVEVESIYYVVHDTTQSFGINSLHLKRI